MDRPITIRAQTVLPSPPRFSIVVPTCDQLIFTRLCLETLLDHEQADAELIVVDNGSTDGTAEYLRELARLSGRVRIALNATNRGFAAAVNRGLTAAAGEFLVILNNDTIVSQGWLDRLAAALADGSVGLAGPVTNRTCNQQQIDTCYRTLGQFEELGREIAATFAGRCFEIPMAAMFCTAMRRDVFQKVGLLDEQFGIGTFEDDDYALRVRQAGYRIVCAENVLLHHFGEATLGRIAPSGEYADLFRRNQKIFERKWGIVWKAHNRRQGSGYNAMIEKVRLLVARLTPPQATLAVVSKGDQQLLLLEERRAWHFPQSDRGDYTGHHPSDSAEAIAHLETLRTKGAQYLLVPQRSLWWLNHYSEFGQYLRVRYKLVAHQDDACALFNLGTDFQAGPSGEA
jgi:GT2 family glycosyltransferase